MSNVKPVDFRTAPAMQLAGIRRQHAFADAPVNIPLQWQEFNALRPLPSQRGELTYGAICASGADGFEYMCAVEVEDFYAVPLHLGRMRVPPQYYAIFEHHGAIATIGQTWRAIFQDWLPRSGYASAPTPDFERYDHRFDPATASGLVEIWFPVVATTDLIDEGRA